MPRGDRLDPSDVDLILRLYRQGTPVKDIAAEVQVSRSTVDVLVRKARAEGRLDGVPVRPRGFGTLTPERRRAIASKGGKAAHAQGKAHQFTGKEAVEAGRKGGRASQERRKR